VGVYGCEEIRGARKGEGLVRVYVCEIVGECEGGGEGVSLCMAIVRNRKVKLEG
jgi:hypothetical protein